MKSLVIFAAIFLLPGMFHAFYRRMNVLKKTQNLKKSLGALLLLTFLLVSSANAQETLNAEKHLLIVQPETVKTDQLPSPQIDDFKTAEEIDLIRRALRHTSLSSRLDVFYNYFSGESRSFENFLSSVQSQENSFSLNPTNREVFATREKFFTLLKSDNPEGNSAQRLDVRMNRRLSFEYHNPFISPHLYLDPLQRRISLALVKTLPWATTVSAYYDPIRKESLGLISHRFNEKTEFRTILFHSDKTRENNVLATIRFYF